MKTGVRALTSCPICGQVEMLVSAITLHTNDRVFTFTCPVCHDEVEKPACGVVDEALFMNGAVVVV